MSMWQGDKGEPSAAGTGIKGEPGTPGLPGLSGFKVLKLPNKRLVTKATKVSRGKQDLMAQLDQEAHLDYLALQGSLEHQEQRVKLAFQALQVLTERRVLGGSLESQVLLAQQALKVPEGREA
ncbi:unnamed protein product [Coregonus sp. 'balchen']|nr:unnamed protein product [Coregonus sp. 'balchen']